MYNVGKLSTWLTSYNMAFGLLCISLGDHLIKLNTPIDAWKFSDTRIIQQMLNYMIIRTIIW